MFAIQISGFEGEENDRNEEKDVKKRVKNEEKLNGFLLKLVSNVVNIYKKINYKFVD